MNNLHRELAPISDTAWEQIEEEARRTFTQWVAGRRVVDVDGPAGVELSAVGTGHVRRLDEPVEGVTARQRQAQLMVEFRIPFTVTRAAVDDVDRGAKDSDWQPVKDAAQKAAEAEDRTIFYGFPDGGISGITAVSSHQLLTLPSDPKRIPDSVARALSALSFVGVGGPYALLLAANLYTAVSEETDHGYPIRSHLARLVDGEILWAPALDGAILVSTRGGDYTLHLGQELSIGYLSHDAEQIQLWAEWCGPCRMVSPIVDEIAAEHADKLTVAKLNVDENPTTVARYNIKAIPTIAVFHNGSLAKTIVGAQPKAEMERQLADYISGS